MTIPPATTSAAPQVPIAPSTAFSKNDGDAAAAGFAQALLVAGFSNPGSSLPVASPAGAEAATGAQRGGKNPRQQAKGEDGSGAAAGATPSQPAAPALPQGIQPFPQAAGNQEQPGWFQSNWSGSARQPQATSVARGLALLANASTAALAVNVAATAPADPGQPALGLGRGDSAPPVTEDLPLVPAGQPALAENAQLNPTPEIAAPALNSGSLQVGRPGALKGEASGRPSRGKSQPAPTVKMDSAAGAQQASVAGSRPVPFAGPGQPQITTSAQALPQAAPASDASVPAAANSAGADALLISISSYAPALAGSTPAAVTEAPRDSRTTAAGKPSLAAAGKPRHRQPDIAASAAAVPGKGTSAPVSAPAVAAPIAAGPAASSSYKQAPADSSYKQAPADSEAPSLPPAGPFTTARAAEPKAFEAQARPAAPPLNDTSSPVAQSGANGVEGPGAPVVGKTSTAPAGPLAFAARVQPISTPAGEPLPGQPETAASAPALPRMAAESDAAGSTVAAPMAAGADSLSSFNGLAPADSDAPSPLPAVSPRSWQADVAASEPALPRVAAESGVAGPAAVAPIAAGAGASLTSNGQARADSQDPSPSPAVSPRPRQADVAVSAPALSKKDTNSAASGPAVAAPLAAGEGAIPSAYGHASAHAQGPYPEASSTPSAAPFAPARPAEPKVAETPLKPAAVPLKDITLQVAQPGSQKVEVRVVQQSGELRVAVRTGDSDLAHGLQHGLSDLVGRLQDTGFRAEAWHPGGSTAQSGPLFEARTSPGGSQKDDSQSPSGDSRQQPGEKRQNQPQQPGWVEELESSIVGGTQSQGATYGIRG